MSGGRSQEEQMGFKRGQASERNQRGIGVRKHFWWKRSEGGKRWSWQTTRRTVAQPQENPESPPFTPYSFSGALASSGGFEPENLRVKASPADSAQLADENTDKPWHSLRGLSTHVTRQRQKIPLMFRTRRAEIGIEEIHRGPKSGAASSPSAPSKIWNGQPVIHGEGTLMANAFRVDTVERGVQSPQYHTIGPHFNEPSLGEYVHRRASKSKNRGGTVAMVGSSEEESLVELSAISDPRDPASKTVGPRYGNQCGPRKQRVHSLTHEALISAAGSTGESWRPEESSHNYQPQTQTKDRADSAEFVSSAVMIKCPNGEQDAAKMYYDTLSTDNIASRKFVEKYGFNKRLILQEDLKVYDTLAGEFAPTHYVEIELKDTERGIKEFTKVSFNVAESMDGIGLLAGRAFMIRHGVSLNAKEGPGAYVVTSRQGDENAKKAQKQLLDKTATAMEKAKGYAASSASSTTTRAGTSQAQHVAASSQTSTSSGAKNQDKK